MHFHALVCIGTLPINRNLLQHCILDKHGSLIALLPRAHAQGVKQSSVVVGTKIARSRVLGVYAHNQSVDIGEKLVCTGFEFLNKAY